MEATERARNSRPKFILHEGLDEIARWSNAVGSPSRRFIGLRRHEHDSEISAGLEHPRRLDAVHRALDEDIGDEHGRRIGLGEPNSFLRGGRYADEFIAALKQRFCEIDGSDRLIFEN